MNARAGEARSSLRSGCHSRHRRACHIAGCVLGGAPPSLGPVYRAQSTRRPIVRPCPGKPRFSEMSAR